MTDINDRAIVGAVGELRTAVATLTEAVSTLREASLRLERNSVTREAHNALKEDVGDLKIEARAGIARNDDRWAKVAWFVGLFILAALLGVLVSQGGGIK